jgi:hypothetical protein
MVFIETPTSRAAWKTATGAAETMSGSIAHAAHPITFDDSRTNPIRQKATQPPVSTLRIGRVRDSGEGPGHPETGEPLVVAILHSCAVSQGWGDFQADFMRLADPLLWCMRNCGKNAPGDTSRRYPHLLPVSGCAAEKVGSGRRDLVKRSVTFLEFRVSGNPTSSLWQLN